MFRKSNACKTRNWNKSRELLLKINQCFPAPHSQVGMNKEIMEYKFPKSTSPDPAQQIYICSTYLSGIIHDHNYCNTDILDKFVLSVFHECVDVVTDTPHTICCYQSVHARQIFGHLDSGLSLLWNYLPVQSCKFTTDSWNTMTWKGFPHYCPFIYLLFICYLFIYYLLINWLINLFIYPLFIYLFIYLVVSQSVSQLVPAHRRSTDKIIRWPSTDTSLASVSFGYQWFWIIYRWPYGCSQWPQDIIGFRGVTGYESCGLATPYG